MGTVKSLLHKAAAKSPNVEGRRMFKDRSCVDDARLLRRFAARKYKTMGPRARGKGLCPRPRGPRDVLLGLGDVVSHTLCARVEEVACRGVRGAAQLPFRPCILVMLHSSCLTEIRVSNHDRTPPRLRPSHHDDFI